MILHFPRAVVDRLVAHAKAAPEHKPAYGQRPPIKPGLWLVGDDGVYLMSNGQPGLYTADNKNLVAYAVEADPNLPFDQWRAAKENSFGGDDGADYMPLELIEQALATYQPNVPLQLDVTPNQVEAVIFRPRKRRTSKPKA